MDEFFLWRRSFKRWNICLAKMALALIVALAPFEARLDAFAAWDEERVAVQSEPTRIDIPSHNIGVEVGFSKPIAYSVSVEHPIVLRLQIRGEVQKKVSNSLYRRTDIYVTNEETGLTIPAWVFKLDFNKDSTSNKLDAAYLLQSGSYVITLSGVPNSWFGEETEWTLALKLTAESEELMSPDWVPRVNLWLEDSGIGGKLGIIAAFRGPKFAESAGGKESSGVKSLIAEMSMMREWSSSPRAKLSPEQYLALLAREKFFDGKLFIFIANGFNGAELTNIEEEFYEKYNVSLWSRFFRKISLQSGVPAKNIFGEVTVWCDATLLYESWPGEVVRDYRSEICTSQSFARDAPSWLTGQMASAASGMAEGVAEAFTNVVERYLGEKIEAVGGTLDYLYRDETYVEAIVRGVRGWVIRGGNQWEKVQVAFALLGTGENVKVRIFLDGMLASGLGGATPPDSRFTYSMEPEHASALTDFAQATLDDFVNYGREER